MNQTVPIHGTSYPPAAGKRRVAALFGRNTLVSFLVFGLDVFLLWIAVDYMGLPHLPSAGVAFLIAMSLQYMLCRRWVFRGTTRGIATGYLYFLINSGLGLAVTLAVFWALTEWAPLHYLVARVIASVIAGLLVFALNAIYNFKAVNPPTLPGKRKSRSVP